jgi:hypothetical protein
MCIFAWQGVSKVSFRTADGKETADCLGVRIDPRFSTCVLTFETPCRLDKTLGL